ncbi:hypothetical protein RIR_jg28297.t1 [Rhizophagus irregularis DAOM 181602=DAOM 197198]|nr:hypothetical protein RIR_jg28297.t1 [Rhizophagus irregularis DAOM 181602=DAOM 197198]
MKILINDLDYEIIEKLFPSQDASDLLTLGKTRSRVWVKNLPIAVESINNSVTQQLGISPAIAIKKSRVSSRSSYPRDGPVGYEEEKLPPDISVRYLLEPNDLEGGRRRAGDMNWSPKIYHIHMSLTQKNQPVLYWLIDDDGKESERSFVREELLVIPDDTELPPQWYNLYSLLIADKSFGRIDCAVSRTKFSGSSA